MKRPSVRCATRGGCLVKLMVLAAFFVAAVALAWMLFLPALFTHQLRSRTGFDAEVTSFAVNPISGRVVLRGLVITNPPTFPVKDCLQLRTFEANADMGTFFADQLVVDDLTLDVQQLTLVKRTDGHTNLEIFQNNLAGPLPLPPTAKSHYLVRRLQLRFDTLILADHSEKKPRVREYRLGFNQTFQNVSDPKQLLVPNVLRSLVTADVTGAIGGFLPGDFGKLVNEYTKGGESLLKSAGHKANDSFHGFLDKLEEMRKP